MHWGGGGGGAKWGGEATMGRAEGQALGVVRAREGAGDRRKYGGDAAYGAEGATGSCQ